MKFLLFCSVLLAFPSLVFAQVCGKESQGFTSDGEPVTICQEFHKQRPFVRPPQDSGSGPLVKLFVALSYGSSGAFVDRRGNKYLPVDASGAPLKTSELPPGLHVQSNRYIYTVFYVEGKIVGLSETRQNKIGLSKAQPAVLITGCAIDSAISGIWEGLAPKFIPQEKKWSFSYTEPIRFNFPKLKKIENTPVLGRSVPLLPDGTRYELQGEIENLNKSVVDSMGQTMPALTSLGEANPFRIEKNEFKLYRLSGMHVPGQLNIVMGYPRFTQAPLSDNGMTDPNLVEVSNFISVNPIETQMNIGSHGGFPFLHIVIRPVEFAQKPAVCPP